MSHSQKSAIEDHPISPVDSIESHQRAARRDEIKKIIINRAETLLLDPGSEVLSKDEAIVMASSEYELRHQNSAANMLSFQQALDAIRAESDPMDDDID